MFSARLSPAHKFVAGLKPIGNIAANRLKRLHG
jgi:hypothetical protein